MINQTGISPYSNCSKNSSPAFGMAVDVKLAIKKTKTSSEEVLSVFKRIFQDEASAQLS